MHSASEHGSSQSAAPCIEARLGEMLTPSEHHVQPRQLRVELRLGMAEEQSPAQSAERRHQFKPRQLEQVGNCPGHARQRWTCQMTL